MANSSPWELPPVAPNQILRIFSRDHNTLKTLIIRETNSTRYFPNTDGIQQKIRLSDQIVIIDQASSEIL
jgi:hypothetical protein